MSTVAAIFASIACAYLAMGVFTLLLALWRETKRCRYARSRIAQKYISYDTAIHMWETSPKWWGWQLLRGTPGIILGWPIILLIMVIYG